MINIKFEPGHGTKVLRETVGGNKIIKAYGNDPQLRVVRTDGAGSIPAGWYALEVEIKSEKGRLVDPVIYPSYGKGMGEGWRVPVVLSRKWPERQVSIVNFISDVDDLRFDPSVGACEFQLGNAALTPLNRGQAAKEMASAIWLRSIGRKVKLQFAIDIVSALLSGGASGLGRFLKDSYSGLAFHSEVDYGSWVALYGALVPPENGEIEALSYQPKFSVIVPTYNTPEKWLRKCILSVIEQSYQHLELCISDDASPSQHVRSMIEEFKRQDDRIKVVYRETNGHISASSNDAVDLASGDYLVLLDHDDELHPHALFEMAKAINANREARLLFSDEDKVDGAGRRFDPYFKPDWNYDLFLSHNCISHLGVYERKLVEEVGGFREGYEGSQDWDLALRCIERLKPNQIVHIPHVLYHWRAIPGSTALGPQEKSYAHYAAMKAIQSHLDRVGRDAEVVDMPGFSGNYRVRNRLPQSAPKVSLIMPTKDRSDLLRVAVRSILKFTEYDNYEIVIVDNQSVEPETFDLFEELCADPRVKVLEYDQEFNYSAINNFAVNQVRSDVIGLVNNDIEVISSDWLTEMVSQAIRPDVGAVGAMLYFPDDTIQHAGVILGFNGVGVHAFADRPRGWVGMMLRARLLQNYSAVTAACMLLRKEVYVEVGGLDESLKVAYNDLDLCLRIRAAGYRNLWTPYAELYHHESASRGSDMSDENRARFNDEVEIMMSRWGRVIEKDPAYNINLANAGATYDFAFPPRG